MRIRILLTLFAVILAVSGVAMAMNNASVTATDQTRWEAPAVSNDDITQSGNITQADLGESRLTDRWAGYYGNISANIYLRDNTSAEYLYRWSTNSSDITGGEVCASTNSSFPFVDARDTTALEIDGAWGFIGGLDPATNTFNDGACNLTFTQDSRNVTNTVRAKGDSGNSAYATCAIDSQPTDGILAKDEIAFCTDAIRPATGTNYNFKSELVNFELIVATDETGAFETYYFFMEIDG